MKKLLFSYLLKDIAKRLKLYSNIDIKIIDVHTEGVEPFWYYTITIRNMPHELYFEVIYDSLDDDKEFKSELETLLDAVVYALANMVQTD